MLIGFRENGRLDGLVAWTKCSMVFMDIQGKGIN